MLAILDGTVTDAAQAQIPATDDGFLRGDGVFEVMRLYGGRPFAFDDHLARLARSAANLRLPIDLEAVRADVETLLERNDVGDAALRVVVTRGGRRLAIVEELKPLPDTLALATIEYAPTRVLDQVKSLSYAANMLARRLAQEQGADDALLVTPHGRVLEGADDVVLVLAGRRDARHAPAVRAHPRLDHAPAPARRRRGDRAGHRPRRPRPRARGVHGLDAARGPSGAHDRRRRAARRAGARSRRTRRAGSARTSSRSSASPPDPCGSSRSSATGRSSSRRRRSRGCCAPSTTSCSCTPASTTTTSCRRSSSTELGVPRPERELGIHGGDQHRADGADARRAGAAGGRASARTACSSTATRTRRWPAGSSPRRRASRSPTWRPACARSTARCPRSSTACSPTTSPICCCARRRRRSTTSSASTSRGMSSWWAT